MGLLSKMRNFMEKQIGVLYRLGQEHGEIKKIKDPRRVDILSKVVLDKKQKEGIDHFFVENYGKKISYNWHRLYQSYTGKYNEQYFPEILLSSSFEPLVNPVEYRIVLDDKLLLPIFCNSIENVRTPKTIGTYSNGIYFDNDKKIYSRQEFISFIENIGDCIIKPTQDTSSGRGIQKVNFIGGFDSISQKSISDVIKIYNDTSYIIQEVISPNEKLSILNKSSINTFRIVTYIWKGNIFHWPISLRIGRDSNFLDNAHAGGMFISVSDEGVLSEAAFTEFQTVFYEHPDSHVVFKNYKLDFVPELITVVEKMHLNTPQLGLISWDLTVNDKNEIILIEANTRGQTIWFPQMASGKPAFGDNTAEVLRYLKNKN